MQNIINAFNQSIIDRSRIRLEQSLDNYLHLQETDILTKIYYMQVHQLPFSTIRDNFTIYGYEAEPVSKIASPILKSYYRVDESEPETLKAVSILGDENFGIKLVKNVPLDKLHPIGPVKMKIVFTQNSVDQIEEDVSSQEYIPEELQNLPDNAQMRESVIYRNNRIPIVDKNGNEIAEIILIPIAQPFHPNNVPYDNLFGGLILLAGIFSSFIAGRYISNSFVQPLYNISEATKEVAKGNLDAKLLLNSKQDEIITTYKNFNAMVSELKEKADLRKSFISNLTHDFKTPLLAQSRSLGYIAEKFNTLGLKNEYELAKSLEENNDHLLRMVNLILDSYTFDFERVNLIFTENNIKDIINECYQSLLTLFNSKNIQFNNNIPDDIPLIKCDRMSMKRVFINIMSNSLENSKTDGHTSVSAKLNNGFLTLCFADDGYGISQEDLKFLFDRFYTGKSIERTIGLGLGLDVCKTLIEAHKGTIVAESEVGSYTKIIIRLPLTQ